MGTFSYSTNMSFLKWRKEMILRSFFKSKKSITYYRRNYVNIAVGIRQNSNFAEMRGVVLLQQQNKKNNNNIASTSSNIFDETVVVEYINENEPSNGNQFKNERKLGILDMFENQTNDQCTITTLENEKKVK